MWKHLLLVAVVSTTSQLAFGLEGGVAACDITPDVATFNVPMAGYGARLGKPSTGVHDPLRAKVLVLKAGAKQLALVTSDLRSMTPELKTKVLEQIGNLDFTADNVLMCASHTHDGPSMYAEKFWQFQFGKYDPKIVDVMAEQIAQAFRAAVEHLQPVQAGYGECTAEGFSKNRRWEYDTTAREAAGEQPVIDETLRILRVDAEGGAPLALVVNFPTHPTILGADNFLLSAEWPGALQASLESIFPGAAVLYCNGAEGDQAPVEPAGTDEFAQMEQFGQSLAQRAADCARAIQPQAGLTLGYARNAVPLPAVTFSEGAQKSKYAHLAALAQADLPKTAEVQVLLIGGVALAGLPGEPISEVGAAVRQGLGALGCSHVMVIGLANDYLGYILNAKEYAHGGYEVDQRSFYGPTLGELLATAASKVASAAKAE
ncbi:MAG: neutral/alkaline non-lysosomal ceramidase N-terminal domain-containing protein [Candidatus Hydrogenedentes bacterium]|nr:neutral/alkaline non-lysosomal ceramidase N-terminal domain-containing protein [Candidatus Hydrogenedentota bacterium]